MKNIKKIRAIIILSIFSCLFLASNVQVFAQASPVTGTESGSDMSSGVGITVSLNDKNAANGSIVSFTHNGYHLSRIAYDPTVFGIVSDSTSVTLEDPENNNSQSRILLSQGKTSVRVSTKNGVIKAGNLITTSSIAGVGQLASEDGYIVGTALDDYKESDPQKIGVIYISLNLGFNSQSTVLHKNLISNIKNSLTSPYLTPGNTLRYIIAGLAVLIGLGAGLIHFGRTTSNGIEALGRNPLARNAILFSMAVNLILTIIAMGVGLAIAYFILAL